MAQKQSVHGQWGSRWAYFLAATGSAVGLGNIWKFPYITGEHGGGAFVLVYLLCIALVGLPVLIAEVVVGRAGRASPMHTLRRLARDAAASPRWAWMGWLAALAGFLILSFYTVVAGWSLYYGVIAAGGAFEGGDKAAIGALFGSLTGDPWLLTGCSTLFLFLTMLCIGRGVEKGIEASLQYVMPMMLALLLLLVGYSMGNGDFVAGAAFLFEPDFSALSVDAVLVALGHAFFTLGLGAGAMMIYGAYVPDGVDLPRTCLDIALADTVLALLAGLAIFPIVFAHDLPAQSGPGLIFISLPIAFGQMPFGHFFGTVFFIMLALAAYSSAISMIEGMTTIVIEKWHWSRRQAAGILGGAVWVVSLGTVFSFNLWSEPLLFEKNFFDLLDYLTANILLPLVSLGTAVFAGWIMSKTVLKQTLQARSSSAVAVWYATVRYVSPLAILLVFLSAIGVFG